MANLILKTPEVKLLQSRLTVSQTYRRPFEIDWSDIKMADKLFDPKKPRRLYIPFLRTYKKSMVPRWISGIFAGVDFFGLEGRKLKDDDGARQMKMLMDYQADKEMDAVNKLMRLINSLAITGTRIMLIGWDKEKDTVLLKPIRDLDFFPADEGDNIDDNPWDIVREKYTEAELRKFEDLGIYKNIDQIIATTKDDERKDKKYEIYEMWEDKGVTAVYSQSGGGVNLGERPNKFAHKKKPFIQFCSDPEEFSFYGDRPLRDVLSLQKELNQWRHLGARNVDLIIRGIYLGLRGSGIDWERLIKDGITETDDMNALKRMEVGDATGYADKAQANTKADGDRAMGIFDPQRGGGVGELGRTATGITLIIKEGLFRFAQQIRSIQTGGVKRLVELWVSLNQQFITKKKAFKITGKTGREVVEIGKEEIKGDFDYIATSSPHLGNEEVLQSQNEKLYILFKEDPEIKQRPMKEDLFRAYNKDPRRYMRTKEEMEILEREAQLAEEERLRLEEEAQLTGVPIPPTESTPPVGVAPPIPRG